MARRRAEAAAPDLPTGGPRRDGARVLRPAPAALPRHPRRAVRRLQRAARLPADRGRCGLIGCAPRCAPSTTGTRRCAPASPRPATAWSPQTPARPATWRRSRPPPGKGRRSGPGAGRDPVRPGGGELTRRDPDQGRRHRHLLVLVPHHALSDGWSERVLFGELAAAYCRAGVAGTGPAVPRPHRVGVRVGRRSAGSRKDWPSWSRTLAGAPAGLGPPGDRRPGPSGRPGAAAPWPVELPEVAVGNATPFMVALAALAVLLQRYTGSRDQVIGVPVANRERPEVERTVGLFVNSVVAAGDRGRDRALPHRRGPRRAAGRPGPPGRAVRRGASTG